MVALLSSLLGALIIGYLLGRWQRRVKEKAEEVVNNLKPMRAELIIPVDPEQEAEKKLKALQRRVLSKIHKIKNDRTRRK